VKARGSGGEYRLKGFRLKAQAGVQAEGIQAEIGRLKGFRGSG